MGSFQEIDHTADKGLKIKGDNLRDIFETSVEGLAHMFREDLAKDSETVSESFIVEVESEDLTGLLIDFLSEILTLSHIHRMVFLKADIALLEETNIRAEMYGQKVDRFDEDIKAVTYHKADLHEKEDGTFETFIVFDI